MSNNTNNNANNGRNAPQTPTDYTQRGGAQTPTFRKPTPPPPPKTK